MAAGKRSRKCCVCHLLRLDRGNAWSRRSLAGNRGAKLCRAKDRVPLPRIPPIWGPLGGFGAHAEVLEPQLALLGGVPWMQIHRRMCASPPVGHPRVRMVVGWDESCGREWAGSGGVRHLQLCWLPLHLMGTSSVSCRESSSAGHIWSSQGGYQRKTPSPIREKYMLSLKRKNCVYLWVCCGGIPEFPHELLW